MKKTTKETGRAARGKNTRAASPMSRGTSRKETAMADETSNNADFIGRVVGDAKNPPETRMLTGWFGDSGEDGYRRLYTDAELSSYVDIPDDAILYTEPIKDAQPAGAVLVWIKRDAAVKQGGSAFSRAARFVQGQVQQDYASAAASGAAASAADVEKAGFHCVTQVPCGEVTGFTGSCTNEPQVGGAWPCITAPPHCYEVTGFTGKCTHQPWPNPTRYIGCTIFHCPTNDLTHIPHICNIVASGLPGCGGVNPPDKGGDPAALRAGASEEGADNKEAAAPVTSIPGCGYTRNWGLCETHLLGCGQTKDCPTTLPGCGQTNDCPTTMPGCGWSKNPICTDLPGCGFTKHWGACQQTQPPKCQVSVDIPCITQDAACGPTRPPGCGVDAAAQAQQNFTPATVCTQINCQGGGGNQTPATVCTQIGCQAQQQNFTPATVCTQIGCGQNVGAPASIICATNIGCDFTFALCRTHNFVQCHPTILAPICHTRLERQCWPVRSPLCPVFDPGPIFNPGPQFNPVFNPAGGGVAHFGAAINQPPSLGIACSVIDCGTQQPTELCTPVGCPPTKQPTCPSVVVACPTPGCTQTGQGCQTNCGPDCQTQQADCTLIGDLCKTKLQPCTQFGHCNTNPLLECTFGCTQFGPNCVQVTNDPACNINQAQAVGSPRGGTGTIEPSGIIACTQVGINCPSNVYVGAAGPVTVCTQSGPQCPRTHLGQCPSPGIDCTVVVCTHVGPLCPPPTRAACTHLGQCPSPGIDCTAIFCTHAGPQCPNTHPPNCPQPTHQQPCHTPGFECTMFCTQGSPGCPVTQPAPQCFGPLTAPPQCPVHSGVNCPSAIGCQSIACQSIACQPQGGGQQQEFGAAAQVAQGGGGGIRPTIFTQPVFVCNPSVYACPTLHTQPIYHCNPSAIDACPTRICTQLGAQCHPSVNEICPTLHTQPILHCNPSAVDACPTRIGCPTQNPQQCPPHSGFNCPSAIGCQSIACQSIACQPQGGGQQQQFGAAAQVFAAVPIQPAPATHYFICPPRTHQIVQCYPSVVDACPTRLCTQQFLQCHPSIVANACPTQHFVQCNPSAVDACPTRIGCPTQNPVQCPPHSGFNCPSAIGCQSIACQSIACQPGGGQQQQPQQQQQFGAAAGGGGGFGGTQFGPQCRPSDTSVDQLCVVQPVTLDFICTALPHTSIGPNCPPPQTPFCQPVTSFCFTVPCPPHSRFVICTAFGPQCPTPVAEQRPAQQGGGGIHPTIWTQIGPQCPVERKFTFVGCYTIQPYCNTIFAGCAIGG
jgi:hypothetical protein